MKAWIDELLQGRDGQIQTISYRLPDRTKISRPVQLVIPLEIDQGGEDVKDWDIFLLFLWLVICDCFLCSKCIFLIMMSSLVVSKRKVYLYAVSVISLQNNTHLVNSPIEPNIGYPYAL